MCLMRENVKDIPEFVRLAHEIKAVRAHIFHMNLGASYKYDWFDYEDQHCFKDPETHDYYVEKGFQLAKELGVKLEMSGVRSFTKQKSAQEKTEIQHNKKSNRFFCIRPWTHILVTTEGQVYNCCYQSLPKGLGDLSEKSIWDIWNGPLAQELRESTAKGIPHPLCKNTSNPCPELGRI